MRGPAPVHCIKMSLKLFGQLIVIGGQVVSKIISGAYKQALANASKNPNVKKSASSSSVSSSASSMGLDEASKILNCPSSTPREEVIKKYEHLFKMNDRSNSGGSFYLQSKVVRAREAFERQFQELEGSNSNKSK